MAMERSDIMDLLEPDRPDRALNDAAPYVIRALPREATPREATPQQPQQPMGDTAPAPQPVIKVEDLLLAEPQALPHPMLELLQSPPPPQAQTQPHGATHLEHENEPPHPEPQAPRPVQHALAMALRPRGDPAPPAQPAFVVRAPRRAAAAVADIDRIRLGALIDAITAQIISASRGVPVDRAAAAARSTPESLDPAMFLLRAPEACEALRVSKHTLAAVTKRMGVRRWPYAQLQRARAVAVHARHTSSIRTIAAHVWPVVRDALVLGHTKQHTVARAASPSPPPTTDDDDGGDAAAAAAAGSCHTGCRRGSLAKPTPEPVQRPRDDVLRRLRHRK